MAEKMKDSGIVWIGEIPEEWVVAPVSCMSDSRSGGTPDRNNMNYWDNGTIPWMSSGEVNKTNVYETDEKITEAATRGSSAKIIKKNAVMVALNGQGKTKGMSAVLRIDSACNQSLCAFSCYEEKLHYEYLYWCFQSMYTYLRQMSGDDVRDGLAASYVRKRKIPVPLISEQHAIAAHLDRKCGQIDDIIADLQRQIERLQSYKKSLISEAVTKGLNPDVPLKDSGARCVGKIPAHWSVSRIKYLMDGEHPYPIGDGDHGLIKSDDYLEDGIPYIRVLNLTWGRGLCMDNMVYISNDMNSMIKSSELRPRDLLIAKTGATIGKTAIVPDWISLANTTSHVGKITMPKSQCAEFFYHVLNSDVVQKQIEDMSAMQSTRPELGIDGLKNLTVTVPPMEEQQAIATYLDRKCAQIDTILDDKRKQVENMKNHRKSVIYEYVTGKKRVKEV